MRLKGKHENTPQNPVLGLSISLEFMLSSVERLRLACFLSRLATRVLIVRLVMVLLCGAVGLSAVVAVVAWRGIKQSGEARASWKS